MFTYNQRSSESAARSMRRWAMVLVLASLHCTEQSWADDVGAEHSSLKPPGQSPAAAPQATAPPATAPAATARPDMPPAVAPTRFSFGLGLASLRPTKPVNKLLINPFAWGLGGSFTYAPQGGLFIGLSAQHFFGKGQEQVYTSGVSEIPLTADSHQTMISLLLGGDVRLPIFVVRYAMELGVSIFSWDFGDLPYLSLAGYPGMSGTLVGAHIEPSLGIIYPFGHFFVGTDFRYVLTPNSQMPDAYGAQLQLGGRL